MKLAIIFSLLFVIFQNTDINSQSYYSFSNSAGYQSQTSFEYNNDPDDYPRKYYAFSFAMGPRFLSAEKGNLQINFFNQITNELDKSFNTAIDGNYPEIGYHFSISKGKYTKLTHKLFFDITNGRQKAGGLGYSLTWNFPFQHNDNFLIIRTGVNAMIGSFLFNLSTIENPNSDLKILGHKFNDKKVRLALSSEFTTIGTEVEFSYFIYKNINLFMNVSYDIITNMGSNPKISFIPASSEDDYTGAVNFKFLQSNPTISYNNKNITKIPMKYGKLKLSIGASFVINRI